MTQVYNHPINPKNVKQMKAFLSRTIQIPQHLRATPMIMGPYGIGKSEGIRQWAQEYSKYLTQKYIDEGKQDQLFQIEDGSMVAFDPNPVDIRLSMAESGDLKGLPTFSVDKNGVKRTVYAVPDCFPSDPKWAGVIFFDEFNLAQQDVINACYQILTEFRLEAIKFSPNSLIICAGNYREIARNATELPKGINSRLNFIDIEADLNEWISWAIPAGINPNIISYLKLKQDQFYDYDALVNKNIRCMLNPRAWTRVSGFLDIPDYDWEQYLVDDIGGIIGDANAISLKSYLKDTNRFQDPKEILDEGKDFKSDSINGFFGCCISCLSILSRVEGSEFESKLDNFNKALVKLDKRECKAFAATLMMENNKIQSYLINNKPDMIIELSASISNK